MIVAWPARVGDHAKLQALVPVAGFQVTPPSTDTSTLATDPPPVSLAVPVMLTVALVDTIPAVGGNVIAEVGRTLSGVGVGLGGGLGLLTMPHPE